MRRLVSYFLAGVLALSGCTASASDARTRPLRAAPKTHRPAPAPVVMVLGDSYTAGIAATPPEETYAAETARTLGWQIIIAGYGGTGFATPGRVRKTFSTSYEEKLAWRPAPDMVMVAGGHNDWNQPPDLVAGTARQLLMKIRQRWPATELVVTGPMWGGDAPPRALRIRDALKGVAAELRLPFIDPIEERWVTGNRGRRTGTAKLYILADGIHPNPAGNRHFADRLITDLRRLGLDRPHLRGTD
jgi:lysophospholipase L1-like esterase